MNDYNIWTEDDENALNKFVEYNGISAVRERETVRVRAWRVMCRGTYEGMVLQDKKYKFYMAGDKKFDSLRDAVKHSASLRGINNKVVIIKGDN